MYGFDPYPCERDLCPIGSNESRMYIPQARGIPHVGGILNFVDLQSPMRCIESFERFQLAVF